VVVAALVVCLPTSARGQAVAGRVEVSFLAGARKFVSFDPTRSYTQRVNPEIRLKTSSWSETVIGGRLGYRINRTWGIEGSYADFSRYNGRGLADGEFRGGGKVEFSVGVTVGHSFGRIRLAGRLSPGVMWMEELPELLAVSPGSNGTLTVVITRVDDIPVLAAGAVVEIQGPSRLYLRVDVTDNLAWFGGSEGPLNPSVMRHNPELTVGVGWRFW
jgi:hypothetical protein